MKVFPFPLRWLVFASVGVLAACGSSSPTDLAPGSGLHTAVTRPVASGQLTAVNGGTLTLTANNSEITVTTTGTTKVSKTQTVTVSALSDGQCVMVAGLQSADGSVAARTLNISSSNGCTTSSGQPPLRGSGSGFGGGSRYSGTVSAITSNAFTLSEASGSTLTVNTSSTTTVTEAVSESVGSLKTGTCVVALGQPQSNGDLAAATITVSSPGVNGCARGRGGPGAGFGGPGGGSFGGGGGGGSTISA